MLEIPPVIKTYCILEEAENKTATNSLLQFPHLMFHYQLSVKPPSIKENTIVLPVSCHVTLIVRLIIVFILVSVKKRPDRKSQHYLLFHGTSMLWKQSHSFEKHQRGGKVSQNSDSDFLNFTSKVQWHYYSDTLTLIITGALMLKSYAFYFNNGQTLSYWALLTLTNVKHMKDVQRWNVI